MVRLTARSSEGGFTLLEVVVALALLGLLCASAFGVFAAGMRASRAATRYTTAVLEGERVLNDVLANGMTVDAKEGILDSGYRWKAERVPTPSAHADAPAQVLRLQVSVWWPSSHGEQQLDLSTVTLARNQSSPAAADQSGTPSVAPGSQGGRL